MAVEIYDFLEQSSPSLIGWLSIFTLITCIRIIYCRVKGIEKTAHSPLLAELAALPLEILQSVCFVKAIFLGDWISMVLFFWWGPGFVLAALYVVSFRIWKKKIRWSPYKKMISWLCKSNYGTRIITNLLREFILEN